VRRFVAGCAAVVAVSLIAAAPAAAHEQKREKGTPADLPIEDFAAYDGQHTCLSVEQPGVAAFRALVLARYPETGDSGILRGCHVGARSEHKEGRAWDWHVNADDPADRARVTQLINWLLAPDAQGNANARARRLGLMYFIWDQHIWRSYRDPELGLTHPYGGPHPHRDHVHFSFSAAGAAGLTSYWKLGNTAIRPAGTQTAIAVRRYADDALRWFAADELGVHNATTVFGVHLADHVPVVGDWDGDGVATEGLSWRSGRQLMWFLKPAKDAKPDLAFRFGVRGDVPVVGDWDGDGRTTVGVVRKDAGRLRWLLSNDNRTVAAEFHYGKASETPVVGDWDGDGRATAGAVAVDKRDLLRWALGVDAVRRAPVVDVIKLAKEAAEAEAQDAAAKARATKPGASPAASNADARKAAKAAKAAAAAAAARAAAEQAAAEQTARAVEAARRAKVADGVAADRVTAAQRAAKAEKAAQVQARSAKRGATKPAAAAAAPRTPLRVLKTAQRVTFGTRGERPVAGDWDGDGRTTVGTVERQRGLLHWHVSNDAGLTYWSFDHGRSTDRPLAGDLDGGSGAVLPEPRPVTAH
jgi:hypothetical protein